MATEVLDAPVETDQQPAPVPPAKTRRKRAKASNFNSKPSKGVQTKNGPAKTSKPILGQSGGLCGYVVIFYHRLAPYGEVVGDCIPTSYERAAEMAVRVAITPHLGEIRSAATVKRIREEIRAKQWAEAIVTWEDHMKTAKLTEKSYPEQLHIDELPIIVEPPSD